MKSINILLDSNSTKSCIEFYELVAIQVRKEKLKYILNTYVYFGDHFKMLPCAKLQIFKRVFHTIHVCMQYDGLKTMICKNK